MDRFFTMQYSFEQGPIRPPSEAQSLLIRVTRNCPWNKCAFCHSYENTRFSHRSVEDIKGDIRTVRDLTDRIREISWKYGEGGQVTHEIADRVYRDNFSYGDGMRSVVAWLYFGGESVFLQDADSLILKVDDLVDILTYIKEQLPSVNRITSYCRSKTAKRKSVDDFKRLHAAGLTRIHVGLETGYDPLLAFIKKGATAADHIEGGQNIVASGISLCEYIMPGLGGDRWSREHAVETARVLNAINPDFIRLRSLQVRRGTALHEMMGKGEFNPLPEEDVLKEIRLLIGEIDGIDSRLVSDHILNLLEELEGKFPEEKGKLLDMIDRYFRLPEEDRLIYRLGRRKGIYRKIEDLQDEQMYCRLRAVIEKYRQEGPEKLDRDLRKIMHNYI
jgi:radical SAM superfamily enzyme YgiQ (UPF0313 family)